MLLFLVFFDDLVDAEKCMNAFRKFSGKTTDKDQTVKYFKTSFNNSCLKTDLLCCKHFVF